MFKLHHRRGRLGVKRPAVCAFGGPEAAGGQEGLNRQHQPLVDPALVAAGGPGGDFLRVFMQRPANAVAGQIADQRIAALGGKAPDGIADPGEGLAAAHLRNAHLHRTFAVATQPVLRGAHRTKAEGRPGIGEIAVFRGGNVDVHQIAGHQHAVARNPMRDFLIHADAGGTRKVIGGLRRRDRALLREQIAANRIQLARGHAGFHRFRHALQGVGDDAADLLQAGQLILFGDGHDSRCPFLGRTAPSAERPRPVRGPARPTTAGRPVQNTIRPSARRGPAQSGRRSERGADCGRMFSDAGSMLQSEGAISAARSGSSDAFGTARPLATGKGPTPVSDHHLFRRRQLQLGEVALHAVDVPLQAGHIDHIAVVVGRDMALVDVHKALHLGLGARDPAG